MSVCVYVKQVNSIVYDNPLQTFSNLTTLPLWQQESKKAVVKNKKKTLLEPHFVILHDSCPLRFIFKWRNSFSESTKHS